MPLKLIGSLHLRWRVPLDSAKNMVKPATHQTELVNHLQAGQHKRLELQDPTPGHYRWVVPESAQLTLIVGVFRPTDLTLTLELTGSHARASMLGLVATNSEKTSITLNQHHQAPDTQSTALLKGVFGNNAQALLQGLVTIDAGAHNAQASQYHKALLLDARASCKAIPSFAVHNHRVRCNHGAAVGKLAIDQLTYLQSRGIPEVLARQILINGFVQEIIESLESLDQHNWRQSVAHVMGN
jgi:hypothetical protein